MEQQSVTCELLGVVTCLVLAGIGVAMALNQLKTYMKEIVMALLATFFSLIVANLSTDVFNTFIPQKTVVATVTQVPAITFSDVFAGFAFFVSIFCALVSMMIGKKDKKNTGTEELESSQVSEPERTTPVPQDNNTPYTTCRLVLFSFILTNMLVLVLLRISGYSGALGYVPFFALLTCALTYSFKYRCVILVREIIWLYRYMSERIHALLSIILVLLFALLIHPQLFHLHS